MRYNCVIILGPTASGKTGISVQLAKKINGEIINCDSQQLIKGLDIGTAKITEEEKVGINHHLFDIISPNEDFSVSKYRELAMNSFNEIISRGNVPIIVGGTGFYINSLLYNYEFGNSEKDSNIRNHYEQLANEKCNEYIYNELVKLDPESASKIHPNDTKRVIRALEIFKISGEKKSNQQLTKNEKIKPLIIGLNLQREELYARINKRVDIMLVNGLFKEIERLHQEGYYEDNNKAKNLPIGYSEWIEYFNNNSTKEEVIDKIKQNSRHYAKRQITWFKRVPNVLWIDIKNKNEVLCKILDAYYLK